MTKKKNNRQKHQKDVSDTSEEEFKKAPYQGKCCSHVVRAVNFGRVKKLLKIGNLALCNGCAISPPAEEESAEVWLCLQCGYRGCGRLSSNKHMLQHFKTIHSDCHSLVLNPSSGVVWCYDCDDEVQLQSSRNLKQCVEFIMKIKGNNSLPSDSNKIVDENKSESVQPSLLETVLKDQTSVNNVSVENIPKKTESKSDLKVKKEVPTKFPVKGLKNLGNTCYFNAVMQNLSQTYLLFRGLEDACSAEIKWEVPQLMVAGDSVVEDTSGETIKIALPREFQLLNSFVKFLRAMSASQSKVEVIDPTNLFSEVQKKSPQFQHFHQQDSHELLRQFLDGLRQDEVKRQKRAILKHFNVGNANSEINDDVRKLIKAYGCYASHTIVEKVFGGLMISTVLCEECKMSSQVFEPFMDMSLPLFEEKQQENYDQLCPLLDGGKQEDVKAGRIRKTDCDLDENEFILNKSKKDYGKPSKHQEKKMKMLEKKEKKKNKKAQNQKCVGELLQNSVEGNEESSKLLDVAIDDETGEQDCISVEPDKLNTLSDAAEDVQSVEVEGNGTSGEMVVSSQADTVNGMEEEMIKKDNSSIEIKETDLKNVVNEASVFSPPKELIPPESEDLECLVLFDQVVYFNKEPIESSSPSFENDEKISRFSDKEVLETELEKGATEDSISPTKLEKGATEDSISPKQTVVDIVEVLDTSAVTSELDPLELEKRMHALSVQLKEVRIRRDSGRQESILSSPSRVEDCESSRTNFASNDSSDDSQDSTEKDENWTHNLSESQTKEWILKSLTTLKPRKQVCPLECSIITCLSHFTKPELLAGNNKFRCENCSETKRRKSGDKKAVVYSNASKQMLIFSPPAILTLHLKRFQQVGMSLRKVNRFVEFPLLLDLAPYCSSACLILPHMASVKNEILYSLYGIVEHSGRLTSGHYTAYVKVAKRTMHQAFMNHLPLAQCDLEQMLRKFSKTNSQSESTSEETNVSEECRWYYISDGHVRESSEAQVLKCQAYLLFYERIK